MIETHSTNRLRMAVNSVAAPPFLEARIRNTILSAGRLAPARRWGLIATAAFAGLVIALSFPYENGHFRFSRSMQDSFIVSISSRMGNLMKAGLGDHIFCSVYRKYPKNAPAVEVLAKRLPEEYRPLIPVVQAKVPEQYKLLITHQCRFHGRRFVHLSWEDDSHVLSLVITKRGQGESFQAEGLLPALVQADIPMYQSGARNFAMTAFETPGFLVYFVSDLPQSENSQMMASIAPDVKELLNKL